ncbi:MAG: porin [Muribaculaceae bacterium]|nr:porin [Muribaculaceae bacterium]
MLKKLITACLFGAASLCSFAQEAEKVDYIPKFSGVIRTRWEIETADGYNRFQVRNVRARLQGKIARPIEYYLQADLCNQGKFQFLDAYVRFYALKGFQIRAGQFVIPFGIEPFRSPGTYIFTNRSFIGKDVDNIRAVGLELTYTLPFAPLTLQAGVFNSGPITDHSKWTKEKTFASKAVYKIGDFAITGGFQSICPDSVRINMIDGGITFTHGRFTAEAEYMYKHYTNKAFKTAHAYNAWVDYGMPLKKGLFNKLSFQGRVDGTTVLSTGTRNAEGLLEANLPYRNRITVGSTLAYVKKKLKCELQLNYEKYLYHSDYTAPQGLRDKVVAEIIVSF